MGLQAIFITGPLSCKGCPCSGNELGLLGEAQVLQVAWDLQGSAGLIIHEPQLMGLCLRDVECPGCGKVARVFLRGCVVNLRWYPDGVVSSDMMLKGEDHWLAFE